MMKLVILMTITVVTTERVVYELWPDVNNIALNRTPLDSVSFLKRYQCARHCHGHPRCSVIGFNLITGSCDLYDDVMFNDDDLENHKDGQRFFFVKKAMCPRRQDFLVFPASGPFVWYSKIPETAAKAKEKCESLCGKLVALSNTDKKEAVLATLDAMGRERRVIIGGSDAKTEGVWLWSDGTPVSNITWNKWEPNGDFNENCMATFRGQMFDVGCHVVYDGFICEIVK